MTSRFCSVSRFHAFHVSQPLRVHARTSMPLINTAKPRATFANTTRRPNSPVSDSASNSSKSRISKVLVTFAQHPKFDQTLRRLGLAVFGVFGSMAIFRYKDYYNDSKIPNQTEKNILAAVCSLEQGYDSDPMIPNAIARKRLTDELAVCLTPVNFKRGYYVIVGEHGTGKTTWVKLVLYSLKKPRGSIYVDCAYNKGYIKSFKRAIGFNDPSDEKDLEKIHESLIDTFEAAAIEYKRLHGEIPVLVVDNVNRLAEYQPRLLDQLQDAAKVAADLSEFCVVFVSSESTVPARMRERSAWSRVQQTHMIGDVSYDEAIEYLRLGGVPEKLHGPIYDLVGGRMIHLTIAQSTMKTNTSFDVFHDEIFTTMKSELSKVGIRKNIEANDENKAASKVISQILANGFIHESNFTAAFKNQKFAKELLAANVLTLDMKSDRVTFESTAMKNFCKEHQEVWKVDEQESGA